MVRGEKSVVRGPSIAIRAVGSVPSLTQPRDEMKPANIVLQGNKKYLRDWLPRLGENITSELTRIIRCGERSGEEKQEDLLSQLNSMTLDRLSAYIGSEMQNLQRADSDLKRKKSKGVHKAVDKFQNFVISFDQFLTAYSGIVDIVKAADAQYGNVACATLSLLFAVSTQHSETTLGVNY